MNSSGPKAAASGRHKRKMRNYLLDKHFQLKYTAFLVAVALLLSAILGVQLWFTSQGVIEQSRQAVGQGQETVRRGKDMLAESRKVSDVVAMSITRDPEYAENPDLAALFKEDTAKREQKLAEEQKRLEQDASRLGQQASYLATQQARTFYALFGVLSLLVIGIGLAGIVFTHKIAGPVYKMTGLLKQVGDGKLTIRGGLRKGDELRHFFETFMVMVQELRSRQESDAKRLGEFIDSAEDLGDKLEPLVALRQEMQNRLDK